MATAEVLSMPNTTILAPPESCMIAAEDLSLFRVTESVDETVDEILRFYHVFDDMEYVNTRRVLRLKKPLAESKLGAMHRGFAFLVDRVYICA